MTALKDKSAELEHYVTPEWAVKAILNVERLVGDVMDPCAGTGILGKTAERYGYPVRMFDIQKWTDDPAILQYDFLSDPVIFGAWKNFTVLMNPPFSKATEFVEQAYRIGASKILCFQRFAWYESEKRRTFWDKYPPARIYVCGSRASCWRYDIYLTRDDAGNYYDPETGRKLAGTSTAHAWFVFDTQHFNLPEYQNQPSLLRLYKPDNDGQQDLFDEGQP